ncbi:hypothetical protein ACU8V4_16515 [Pseudoalteromonas mariniglutinosa]
MKVPLRKSGSSFEFQYEFNCEEINGVQTSVEIENRILIVHIELKPIDANQRTDMSMVLKHINTVTDVVVHEEQIWKNLLKFCRNNKGKFDTKQLLINFGNAGLYTFNVGLRSVDDRGIGFQVEL